MMLERDAPEDMDTAKAVLETLNMLCEVDEQQEGKVRSVLQSCDPLAAY